MSLRLFFCPGIVVPLRYRRGLGSCLVRSGLDDPVGQSGEASGLIAGRSASPRGRPDRGRAKVEKVE
jgi:hypothetical protein